MAPSAAPDNSLEAWMNQTLGAAATINQESRLGTWQSMRRVRRPNRSETQPPRMEPMAPDANQTVTERNVAGMSLVHGFK